MNDKDDDLTKLTDLSEFEHELDPQVEDYFKEKSVAESIDAETEDTLDDDLSEGDEKVVDQLQTNMDEEITTEDNENNFDNDFSFENNFNEEESSEQESSFESNSIEPQNEMTVTDWDEFDHIDKKSDEIETQSPVIEENPDEAFDKSSTDTPLEDFSDLKSLFNPVLNYDASSEGNPPYSILIKNILKEYVDGLFEILSKYSLIQNSESDTLKRIKSGEILIPRISEFACIKITRELKHFPFSLTIGPSEKVYTSSFYEDNNPGGIPSLDNLEHDQDGHIQVKKTDDKN